MENKRIKVKYDKLMLFSMIGLLFVGVVMVYSASAVYSKEHFGNQYLFIFKHISFVAIGLVFFYLGMKFRHNFLKKLSYVLLAISLALLVFLVASNQGVHRSGTAARWISLFGFSFQPAEFAKVALILFLATYISRIGERITSFRKGFGPCVGISGLFIVLIVIQPDFGTAMALSFIVFMMLFIAGARLSYLAGTILLILPPAVYLVVNSGYRLKRILAFLNPWEDPFGSGFQVIQSLIAFANGGFWGEGLGDGKQKLLYLPEGHTDFIFSVIGEELGFIGVFAVVFLFGILIYKGFSIARKRRDAFSVLLASGITTMIGIQAFIHIGVTMGLLPTKGLTLPFISYGGSSLIATMFASGLLLNLSSRMNQVPGFNISRRRLAS